MGKCKEPKQLLVDMRFMDTPEMRELESKGHSVTYLGMSQYDMVIGPTCQWCSSGRLAYVVKKLKEIVKEVKGA